MKKNILLFLSAAVFLVFTLKSYAQSQFSEASEVYNDSSNYEDEEDAVEKEPFVYKAGPVVIPEAKRPKKVTGEQIMEVELKDATHATTEYVSKCRDTFKYGLETEISTLIDDIIKAEDLRFVDEIYDLFYTTRNVTIRQKILSYFTKLKDPCLENYAVTILDDPYDEKNATVSACFEYVAAVECKAAIPCVIHLLDKEDEQYFNGALTCLGEIAGTEEALYLAEYLDRDDLSVAQRQSLMKVLGKIRALETWEKLSGIAQDTDENTFVRMYAAEAIGAMEKAESEDILINLFEDDDLNLRVYVLKGIRHFKDERADNIILQALRDSQWKVRLEAIDCVNERELKAASPFLIYRLKDSAEEKNVKTKCYPVLAKLNTQEGNEYLISLLKDTKVPDATKGMVAGALLEFNHAGLKEIIELAEQSLEKDLMKNLRYTLGKEFAKWGRPEYEEICAKYLASKDVATQGTGLDIFAKGRYKNLYPVVEAMADEAREKESEEADGTRTTTAPRTRNANATKALRILQQLEGLN